jgi:hypothetical protein
MTNNPNEVAIDPNDLIEKLNDLESQCEGDLAHVIERLLLENHVLACQQSKGFQRGKKFEFSQFPRFLRFDDSLNTETTSETLNE